MADTKTVTITITETGNSVSIQSDTTKDLEGSIPAIIAKGAMDYIVHIMNKATGQNKELRENN